MLGGTTRIGNVLGSAPSADAETARLNSFMKAATSVGLHLLLCEPGTKRPVDMRSAVQRRKDDGVAQDAAREAGRRNWSGAKSPSGVHLATDNPTLLTRYLKKYRETYGESVPVNFAIAVGPSRLVVVDCDTADQVRAFLVDMGMDPNTHPVAPTVRSPGQRDEHGNWVHSDGGHYYFTVPDGVELPTDVGSMTMPGGYVVMWHGRYVLIPPSVRAEGPYVFAGSDHDLTAEMHSAIMAHAATRRERAANRERNIGSDFANNVDAWAETVEWDELLSIAGWTPTNSVDSCGCAVYTAPGAHGSIKSGTAHDTGCGYGRYTEENAPLHIWTDNPGEPLASFLAANGGIKTVSKLQIVAALFHGGDVGTAANEIGLIPREDLGFDGGSALADAGVSMSNLEVPNGLDHNPWTISADAAKRGESAGQLPSNPQQPSNPLPGNASGQVVDTLPDGTPVVAGSAFTALMNPAVEAAKQRAHAAATAMLEAQPACMFSDPLGSGDEDDSPFADPAGLLFPEDYDNEYGPLEPVEVMSAVSFAASAHGQPYVYGGATDASGFVGHMAAVAAELAKVDMYAGLFADPVGYTDDEDEPEWYPPTPPTPDVGDEDGEPTDPHMPNIQPFDYWREFPAPTFVVEGLIEQGGFASIIGPPGVGKSAVAIDIAASIVTGKRWNGRKTRRQRACYMPGEGLSGAVQRIKAWEQAHDKNIGQDMFVSDTVIQAGAPSSAWSGLVAYILKNQIGVLIFDTWARMNAGVEENSATDVGKVIMRLDRVRQLTGCTIIVVHHTNKTAGSETGRGSSALHGALETELLVREGTWWEPTAADGPGSFPPGKVLELKVTKQKNAEVPDVEIPLLMMQMYDSIVMTGPTGVVSDDVFDQFADPITREREPLVETAIRIADVVAQFPSQGVTRTEIREAVKMDAFTAGRKDAAKVWRMTIAKAVDLAIRYGLIQTLTGTPSGARYIPDATTHEMARRAAGNEVMNMDNAA